MTSAAFRANVANDNNVGAFIATMTPVAAGAGGAGSSPTAAASSPAPATSSPAAPGNRDKHRRRRA